MTLSVIYIIGLILLTIFMYYEDKSILKYKVNWIFLILYPLIIVYIVLIAILFTLHGLLFRRPPNDIS